MSKLDCMVISAQNKMRRFGERVVEFMTSERGVSNVVATIIILLIVVLLIGMFWDKLKEWINGIMDQIFSTSFS